MKVFRIFKDPKNLGEFRINSKLNYTSVSSSPSRADVPMSANLLNCL